MPARDHARAGQEPDGRRARDASPQVPAALPTSLGEQQSQRLARWLVVGLAAVRAVIEQHGRLLQRDSVQQRRQRSQPGQLTAAGGTVGQVTINDVPSGGLDRAEHVDRQCLAHAGALVTAHGLGLAPDTVLPILVITLSYSSAVHPIRSVPGVRRMRAWQHASSQTGQ